MLSIIKSAPVSDYRAKTTLWFAVTALFILPPFVINNFLQRRIVVGVLSLLVVSVLCVHAWYIRRGQFLPLVNAFGLVPAIIAFLVASMHRQGMIGALWCYPAIPAFYFILPSRYALIASICLLIVALPQVWLILEPELAIRVAATLVAVTAFSGIFVRVITHQQSRLEEQEEQRREGMASVSHELRTPLATLMAQVEAMHDGIRPLDKEQLSTVSRSVDHLSHLVDDLYHLALADVSALVCRATPERLDRIVEEAVDMARGKLARRQLSVAMQIDKPIVVNGEERLLRQIIDNLLENCHRYTNTAGEVFIALDKNENECELTVADNGPGVSDNALRSLFDRFFRVDTSRARENGGSGLGLSLVKAFTEAHCGHVTAYHTAQGGLGITISLPLASSNHPDTIDRQ